MLQMMLLTHPLKGSVSFFALGLREKMFPKTGRQEDTLNAVPVACP